MPEFQVGTIDLGVLLLQTGLQIVAIAWQKLTF
jgi:hypothetical protein